MVSLVARDYAAPERRPTSTTGYGPGVAGAVVIVVILLAFPLLVGIGAVFLAATLGGLLNADQATRFEGTELAELNQ